MKQIMTIVLIVASILSISACGTAPKSRAHFKELMMEGSGVGPWKRMTFSKTIQQSFNKAFGLINKKLQSCVPEGYQTVRMSGGNISSQSVNNNSRIERVSAGKAEITVQQFHSGTVMQSEGGFYLLAADMAKISNSSIKIDFFVSKHYLSVADAIENWANGSEKCHGIGGNP